MTFQGPTRNSNLPLESVPFSFGKPAWFSSALTTEVPVVKLLY